MKEGVHHIALRTQNLSRLELFFSEVFRAKVLRRQEQRAVWFQIGTGVLMLEIAEAGEPAVPAGSMELLCFPIEGSDLASFRERLAEAGVAVEAETPFTLYFRDPDGRRLGVSTYRFSAKVD